MRIMDHVQVPSRLNAQFATLRIVTLLEVFSLTSLYDHVFIQPLQRLGWWKMLNISVAQLESVKQPLPRVALTVRVEEKLEDKKEQWQRKMERRKSHRQLLTAQFVTLTGVMLMTSLPTNFLPSGTDKPPLSAQEGSLNAKIIQQALPTVFFLSYLVVKV